MQIPRTRHDIRGMCFQGVPSLPPFDLSAAVNTVGSDASGLLGGLGGGGFGSLFGFQANSGGGGGGQSQNNYGLNVLPVQANFLDPTSTSTYNPTIISNPSVTQGLFGNSLIIGPQIAGPHTSSSASLFGGSSAGGVGSGGNAGGNVSDNINYAPQTTLVSNLPPPLQMPGQTPMNLGNPMGSPVGGMMPMPNPGNPLANLMTTPQPIAAGGVSPVLASMMAMPQQQQLSGGQQVIPGTASQSGGYDQPPMPQGGGNPSNPMMMPQMGRGNPTSMFGALMPSAMAYGGGNPLVPAPPAYTPSQAQLGPSIGEQAQDAGVPQDFASQESDALNRSEAATRQGGAAVTDYMEKKEQKRAQREEDKRARLEQAGFDLQKAKRERRELEDLAKIQRSPGGQAILEARAAQDASLAVLHRRTGNQFPVPQVPVPRAYDLYGLRREPLIHIGGQRPQATMPDPIAVRGLEEQEGQLYNQTKAAQMAFYHRDLRDDFARNHQDIEDGNKQFTDIHKEFKDRESEERQSDLDDFKAKLSQIRLVQGGAKFEGTTGHRGVMEGIAAGNLAVGKGNLKVKQSAEKRAGEMAPIVKAKDIAQTASANAYAASQGGAVSDANKISKLVKAGVPEATAKKMLDILAR